MGLGSWFVTRSIRTITHSGEPGDIREPENPGPSLKIGIQALALGSLYVQLYQNGCGNEIHLTLYFPLGVLVQPLGEIFRGDRWQLRGDRRGGREDRRRGGGGGRVGREGGGRWLGGRGRSHLFFGREQSFCSLKTIMRLFTIHSYNLVICVKALLSELEVTAK